MDGFLWVGTTSRSILGPPAKGRPGPCQTKSSMQELKPPNLTRDVGDNRSSLLKTRKTKTLLNVLNWYDISRVGPCQKLSKNMWHSDSTDLSYIVIGCQSQVKFQEFFTCCHPSPPSQSVAAEACLGWHCSSRSDQSSDPVLAWWSFFNLVIIILIWWSLF